MSDGVYFLDCQRGEEQKSTLAFYKNIAPFGGNDGQFPDAISDIKAGFIVWESGRIEEHKFGDGVNFKWFINTDAASKADGTEVGFASNGFRDFKIFKDRTRVLFLTGDNFACTTVYFAK